MLLTICKKCKCDCLYLYSNRNKNNFCSVKCKLLYENEKNICCICLSNKSNIGFEYCKHFCTCEDCAFRLEKCPLCRVLINNKYIINI
jgi:hypothetical protein